MYELNPLQTLTYTTHHIAILKVMNRIVIFIMYSVALLSLLQSISCTVYTVISDLEYYSNTTVTCHHCYNLQHYLLNINKYFTSNTQLFFLPGRHHLHTDLVIQNVHNISLIGSTANGAETSITADSSYVLMINISSLTLKDIEIYAYKPQGLYNWVPLTIKDCSFVVLYKLQVRQQSYRANYNFALVGINIMGDSYISHATFSNKIYLFYNNQTHRDGEHHILAMKNCTVSSIKVNMFQDSYKVTLKMIDTKIQSTVHELADSDNDSLIHAGELGPNEILITNCQFVENLYVEYLFIFASSNNGSVKFINCQFINNYNRATTIYGTTNRIVQVGPHHKQPALIKLNLSAILELKNCHLHANSEREVQILQTNGDSRNPEIVVIKNTTFSYYYISKTTSNPTNEIQLDYNNLDLSFIHLSNSTLLLEDLVVLTNISTLYSIISLKGNSTIVISGSVEFSYNHARELINFNDNDIKYITVKENSVISVTDNNVQSLFGTKQAIVKYPYPFCLFQYFSTIVSMEKRNFLIRFYNNQCKEVLRSGCYDNIPVTHCLWLPQSLFNNSIPLEVNNKYIQFINNSGTYNLSQTIYQSTLCVCANVTYHDCHIFNLGYLYAGQTLTISLHNHRVDTSNAVVVKTDIDQQYVTPCIVLDISENLQLINEHCTTLHYTIGFPTDNYCELFLKLASDSDEYLNIFYIRQMTCPTGFVKIDKRCQCDPVLVQYGITNCNINDQTILRPANSWISATTHNNFYTYHISLHCPFHYCLPHSSHLNFSTPNSQCQFNRSGLLCGHCQQGLSTVFSSSHCQDCSSIYVLLFIPIAIAGLVLVLLLFVLNLTVTDGTINGFILYANIISINTPLFFAELNHFTPTYTFISLANLDLGIQTCFFNGMDDYAKMWLQLAFPFYLIFIATLIIITSRYSTTIQRLTAHRALPVLATLFLLSYTKILRIVSSILFFYSTIIHLPSKHTTLVWSVDANIPLFGVRFTILFIVCLILFLILVPFNVILLFTRMLSRFRFITKFKPLLDAYQGPYKDKYYYWTGLQLLIRAVIFGISSLDGNINFTVSIILFGIIGVIQAIVHPFKMNYKNYQELILTINLQGLYAISLYNTNATAVINIIITMAAVHFIFIITYHMITYLYGGVIRNKIQLSVSTLTGWIIRLHNKSQPQQFQLQDNIRDNIPEVAFNYREYREPLLGQD